MARFGAAGVPSAAHLARRFSDRRGQGAPGRGGGARHAAPRSAAHRGLRHLPHHRRPRRRLAGGERGQRSARRRASPMPCAMPGERCTPGGSSGTRPTFPRPGRPCSTPRPKRWWPWPGSGFRPAIGGPSVASVTARESARSTGPCRARCPGRHRCAGRPGPSTSEGRSTRCRPVRPTWRPDATRSAPTAWWSSPGWSTRPGRPAGSQTLWAYCHVPRGSTIDMTSRIEAQIERFAPGFKDLVLARSTVTSMEVERHNPNYVGGDISGGAGTIRQTVFRPAVRWNPYRTGAARPLPLLRLHPARRRGARHVRGGRGAGRARRPQAPGLVTDHRPRWMRAAIGGPDREREGDRWSVPPGYPSSTAPKSRQVLGTPSAGNRPSSPRKFPRKQAPSPTSVAPQEQDHGGEGGVAEPVGNGPGRLPLRPVAVRRRPQPRTGLVLLAVAGDVGRRRGQGEGDDRGPGEALPAPGPVPPLLGGAVIPEGRGLVGTLQQQPGGPPGVPGRWGPQGVAEQLVDQAGIDRAVGEASHHAPPPDGLGHLHRTLSTPALTPASAVACGPAGPRYTPRGPNGNVDQAGRV